MPPLAPTFNPELTSRTCSAVSPENLKLSKIFIFNGMILLQREYQIENLLYFKKPKTPWFQFLVEKYYTFWDEIVQGSI